MNTYARAFLLGVRKQWQDRTTLIGRMFVFFVVVYLFQQVFESVGALKERLGYLVMTQAITLSVSTLVLRVADEIRSRQVFYAFLLPVSYLLLRLFEALGESLVRFLFLFSLGFCFLAAAGQTPSFFFIAKAVGGGVVSLILSLLLSFCVGVASFWLEETKTLFYLNLTATFCFGGLIVPLSLYPEAMRSLCFWTPYPWVLWWPASLLTGGEVLGGVTTFYFLFAWIVLLLGISRGLFHLLSLSFFREGG